MPSALVLREETSEAAELLTEERAEPMELDSEARLEAMEETASVPVTVEEMTEVASSVVWAETRATKPARTAAAVKRMLTVKLRILV